MNEQDLNDRIISWLMGSDTGISSETMLSIFRGRPKLDGHFGFSGPHDPSDFGRCYRLLKLIPEIKTAFEKIGEKVPSFKGIVENWDEIALAYERELAGGTGKAPDTYALIKKYRRSH